MKERRNLKMLASKGALGLSAMVVFASCSATTSEKKDFLTSYDGLKQESKFSDATTYSGDLTRLQKYGKVYLEKVEVREPKKMDKYEVTKEEITKLEASLKAALVTELGKTRYKVVSKKGKDTLSLRVAVTNFYPGNPTVFAASYAPYVSAATSAVGLLTGKKPGMGTATMEAEVIDSVTRERFYSIVDRDKGNRLQPKAGMSRYGHIKNSFEEWAERLTKKILADTEAQVAKKGATKVN